MPKLKHKISKENSFDLNLKWHFPGSRKYTFTYIALFVVLIIIYGNSFHCAWHFDDAPNILNNPNAQLTSLSWENIKKSVFTTATGRQYLNRPLPRLSFALNYYIGKHNVFGYHVFNFVIHYCATIFLFLFIYNALQLPLLRSRYQNTAYAIALLSVFLWATHPIQVTAVTYIIQRMASMAGMFYIMAMYFYLKGRTATGTIKQVVRFALCGVAAIFSFASKENAAMLPASLFMFDLFLIQGATNQNIKKNVKIIVLPLLITLVLGFFYVTQSSILDEYDSLPFTLFERLLTEPRVIIFYISLLLYPTSSRLTFLHDMTISQSVFTPWYTLPAMFMILIFIIFAIKICRKRPLIAYCILFFFLNHLIEGSIIPLELIYEHTNYLPSMLFFVPLSILIVTFFDYFSYNKSLQFLGSLMFISICVAQGHTTYLRNSIFNNSVTLWSDNIKKSPNLNRPRHGLGSALFAMGYYEEGLLELQKALTSKSAGNIRQKFRTHFNLGLYYNYIAEYEKALDHLFKSLEYQPNNPDTYNQIALALACKNSFDNAETHIRKGMRLNPESAKIRTTLSLILLRKGRVDEAIKEGKKALMLDDKFSGALYLIGESYRLKGQLKPSVYYFEQHLRKYPNQLAVNISLIELYYLLNDQTALKQRVFHLISLVKKRPLSEILKAYHNEINCLDDSRIQRVVHAIEKTLSQQSMDLTRLLEQLSLKEKKGTSIPKGLAP
jgi:tetratricopeptide (TPR) repeat protein